MPIALPITLIPRVRTLTTTRCWRVKTLLLLSLISFRERRFPTVVRPLILCVLRPRCYVSTRRSTHKTAMSRYDILFYKDGLTYHILEGFRLKELYTPDEVIVLTLYEVLHHQW